MTSCAYIYLYVQYKTRLITQCTVHCPMTRDCFLTMDNSLCLALPRLLLLLGQVCEVVSHSVCYCWPSMLHVNRDLTTGVLKIRTKKETIKGRRDCKGTLDRLLALFFSNTFNQNELGLSTGDWPALLHQWPRRTWRFSKTAGECHFIVTDPGRVLTMISHAPYTIEICGITLLALHSGIESVKLKVKVNSLCLSSDYFHLIGSWKWWDPPFCTSHIHGDRFWFQFRNVAG